MWLLRHAHGIVKSKKRKILGRILLLPLEIRSYAFVVLNISLILAKNRELKTRIKGRPPKDIQNSLDPSYWILLENPLHKSPKSRRSDC